MGAGPGFEGRAQDVEFLTGAPGRGVSPEGARETWPGASGIFARETSATYPVLCCSSRSPPAAQLRSWQEGVEVLPRLGSPQR